MSNVQSIVIVGTGRVGKPLKSRLVEQGHKAYSARLDPEKGLQLEQTIEKQMPLNLDALVICVSAAGKSWRWDTLLNGLVAQIKSQKVVAKKIILVSSSRVHEVNQGLITAEMPVNPVSLKTQQIVAGEKALFNSSPNVWLLRCCGIYGDDYPKYTPIMLAAKDKPRCGVTSQLIIERLLTLINQQSWQSGIEILSDGFCYFEGEKIAIDDQRVAQISLNHRVLKSSQTVTTAYIES